MSRRFIVSAGHTEPEIRQRGSIYQKGRTKTEPWIPEQRAYGFYRVDVPGQTKQKEVRVPLGFRRDRRSAELELHRLMQKAGVLDPEKIRERITPATSFREQAEWMIAEIKAGRIVNKKTREPIGERTIDYYSDAIAYLTGAVGEQPLAALDNPEARDLVTRMKSETKSDGSKRFGASGKTVGEYFRLFRCVIASARDEKLKRLYPREWDFAYIGLPRLSKRKQHRPTLSGEEMTYVVANTKGRYQMGSALLAGCDARISELLALCIERHVSDDRSTLYIRQQRSKKGNTVKPTLKTDAAYRDIDLCSALAKMLDAFIGDRKKGFLFQTRSGKMLSPESFYRDGLKKIFKRMGRAHVRFNAFRRFRESVLLKSECRQILIDYWMGHENPDMSARYGRQLVEDVKYRKEWAEKVGLGFELPQVSEHRLDVSCATCATNSTEQACSTSA
jgi:Phage integrase family